jgi:hypothetical protein
MADILDFNKATKKPDMDVLVYACPCKTLTNSNFHSSFYIYQTGYECTGCGMFHSFDNVHK